MKKDKTELSDKSENPTAKENLVVTSRSLLWWVAISVMILVLSGVGPALVQESAALGLREFLIILTGGALLAAAAFSVGGLLGFLFGIPRTLQQENPATPPGNNASETSSYRQGVNTNLEQISDWLTKILVGVGLTQLNEFPARLWVLGENLAVANSTPFTVALILNFVISGFFAGYLLTRLFLAGAFYDADSRVTERAERGKILAQAGAHSKAADEYEQAVVAITVDTPKQRVRKVYENLLFNSLYKDPPEGFQKVITYAKKYIEEHPDLPSGLVWAYLACAYGQQYTYELSAGKKAPELASIRELALEAIRRALKINPEIKRLLNSIWDPNAVKSPGDNDLEVFFEDNAFKELLEVKNE